MIRCHQIYHRMCIKVICWEGREGYCLYQCKLFESLRSSSIHHHRALNFVMGRPRKRVEIFPPVWKWSFANQFDWKSSILFSRQSFLTNLFFWNWVHQKIFTWSLPKIFRPSSVRLDTSLVFDKITHRYIESISGNPNNSTLAIFHHISSHKEIPYPT